MAGSIQDPATSMPRNRILLLALIGLLAVLAIGTGYLCYQERQGGIEIEIDGQGLRIDEN